jgi:hypothetical protein
MSYKISWLIVFASLTSCQVYQSDFDCPPSRGVPCTSVSDIQRMILETPDGGPDIFSESFPSEFGSLCPNETCRNRKGIETNKRIWVGESADKTIAVQGHYIYFKESNDGDTCE